MDGKRIIAIIPARGGSKSIPKKNMIDFCGKPLIAWSIEHALGSRHVDGVYVSTDNEEIASISEEFGASIIERPSELATDTSSSEVVLDHAITEVQKACGNIDLVVFLQATSPVRESSDIDNACETLLTENFDSLFSAAVLDDFCVWEKTQQGMESVTFNYLDRGMRQDREPYFLENGSIYIFKPNILIEHNNRLGGRIGIYLMPMWKSFEIDSLEDLDFCSYVMSNKLIQKKDDDESLSDVELIVYDFDGVMTDNKVLVREDGKESVIVNRSDGLAVGMIKQSGFRQMIFSTEKNKVVEARARKLGIPVVAGVDDKKEALSSYCKDNKIHLDNVIYIGNDINDLEVMMSVGYPICPQDAYPNIRKISRIVLSSPGGYGVIRELLALIKM